MRLVSISDIHINPYDERGTESFKKFVAHPLVQESTHVALMGDIFDLMAGYHPEYYKRWDEIFEALRKLCESGKILYVAEGNHDMHLGKLLRKLSEKWGDEVGHRLIHIPDYLVIELSGQTIHLSHGDELNKEDKSYLKYKKFIKRPALRIVADYIMPLKVLDFIGEKASKQSRKYGASSFDEEKVKDLFRKGLKEFENSQVDFIVGGHSHVEDHFQFSNKTYLNNGYPPKSNKFIVIDSLGGRLENLS